MQAQPAVPLPALRPFPAAWAAAALLTVLLPALLPSGGVLAARLWATLGLASPLAWSGGLWLSLALGAGLGGWQLLRARIRPDVGKIHWAGGLLMALCLLPLLDALRFSPPVSSPALSLAGRTAQALPLPWGALLAVAALMMPMFWRVSGERQPARFTSALASGVLAFGLAGLGSLALLRLNLRGLGLGGLLLTGLALLAGLGTALRLLGRQLLRLLRVPSAPLLEALCGLGALTLLTLEPRVAAPAALLGGVWGLGQSLSGWQALRPAAR